MKKQEPWKTAPISATCEAREDFTVRKHCDKPTEYAYPAMGGGWMALCRLHGRKHLTPGSGCQPIEELIRKGETFA